MTIDLVKAKAESFGISLKKKGIVNVPPLRVVADYDVSGSMAGLYHSGAVQDVADQVLGVAFKFDDNGEIDVFAFDDSTKYVGTSGVNDYGSYVRNNIAGLVGGSTIYSKCLQANIDFLFSSTPAQPAKKGIFGMGGQPAIPGKPKNTMPALVLFFTDGEPNGGDDPAAVIRAAQNEPVYFHMIGIGHSTFHKLSDLADEFDHCGFIHIPDVRLSDEEMYKQIVTDEFVTWLKSIGATS